MLIDELVAATDTTAVTRFLITRDCILVRENHLTEEGLVENVAQTIAAHAGYLYRQKELPVPVGFIAAIKNLVITTRPPVESWLETTITITNNVFDVTVAQGVITHADQPGNEICQCELKVFTKTKAP